MTRPLDEAVTAPPDGMIFTSVPSPTAPPEDSPTPAATLPPVEGVAGEQSIGDPYIPELGNTGYDVQHYVLRLALDPAQTEVERLVTIEAVATLDELAQLSLDFIGFQVHSVMVEGEETAFSREDGKLLVNLPQALDEGGAFAIDVAYSGAPVMEPSPYVPFVSHLGIRFQPEGQRLYVVAEPDGARYWFPNNDHPRDKATYRFELTVPEELVAVANGMLVETHTEVAEAFADGRTGDVYIWEHEYPMASYLATVAVGDYVRVEGETESGVLLRHYVFPENEQAFETVQPQVADMIEFMSERFGPYPFEAFGFVQVLGNGVSLETQTMVLLSEEAGVGVMAHELAHMWFGDWVSLDSWSDIWRNEGFATYVSALWLEQSVEQVEEVVAGYEAFVADNPRDFVLDEPPPGELFGAHSYFEGALVAHQLREEVGDQAFFTGLQRYFERYGGGTATHEEFQAVLEEATGHSLDEFFASRLGAP